MKKYLVEFVGTGLFVLCIIAIIANKTALLPVHIGLSLMTLVYMGAHVSGAHYNPAVTLWLFLRKKINLSDSVGYIIAQLLGAGIAFFVAKVWLNIVLPETIIVSDMLAVFVAEAVFTFALVSVVLFTAASKASSGNSYFGLAIGAVVIAGASAVWNISGGFFNPAVLLGVGLSGISWSWVTILLGNIVGAVVASFFHATTNEK